MKLDADEELESQSTAHNSKDLGDLESSIDGEVNKQLPDNATSACSDNDRISERDLASELS